ncbi:adenylate kinase [Ruegeria meonggei]|uniref:Adenylate kinase n=1 Tax=Ruegeria meonggei TaxID=1446476 RepID=A0A1X6Z492_9RHOB|nr:adenylate kinase [Ruegeria meonggei]SLN40317.1 Adenylate kinase [Ruegeria meonggei]
MATVDSDQPTKIVVMFGPPGSGKGTQARRLADELGYIQISTGDLLRSAVEAQSTLGLIAKATMEAGGLVSDDIVLALLKERLAEPDTQAGVIFDGYPRTVAQAKALDLLLKRSGQRVGKVVELKVNDDELVERITGRHTCADCGEGYHIRFKRPKLEGVCDVCGGTRFKRRADDTAETVRTRLSEYYEQTLPVLSYYVPKGAVSTLDGADSVDEVFADLMSVVSAKSRVDT